MPDVQIKPQVYKDPRPKEHFDQFHERVRKGPPGPMYELVRVVAVPYAAILFRARAIHSERVPNGPVILAPNHASFLDHFFTGMYLRRRIQFMGKSQLFGGGIGEWIFTHGGVFPVRRGYHDEEAFITAFKVLGRGGTIVMYCEGGRSRTGRIADQAKTGIGRLALESGAPVVPVAILGSYKARNWKRLKIPRVTIEYGEPFRFEVVPESSREQQQEVADYVLERIRQLHGELERRGHPTLRRALSRRVMQSPPPQPPEGQAPRSPSHAS